MIGMALTEIIGTAALEGILAQSGGFEVVRDYGRKLREAHWSREYVDAIGAVRGWLSLEETAVFAQLHTKIYGGLVGMTRIETGVPPRPDREREVNADALAALPAPFGATVDRHQVNEPRDGILTWDEPISISLATGIRDDDGITLAVHYMIPPGWAPLEIGNTPPSRTWQHLIWEEGTLARWPYGHEWIRLFVNFDHVPRGRGMPLPLTPG